MKKGISILVRLFTVLGVIMCSFTSNAQLLWKISGNGIKNDSYLYGTLHMMCPKDFKISDALKKSFDDTEQLVLEIDMDTPNFMMEVQKLSMNPGMKNIYTEIKEKDKKIINDFLLKNFKMSLNQVGVMKPFALMSMATSKLLECPIQSYEASFVKISKEQKEEVLGLETIKDQLSIFDSLSKEKQIELLVKTIEEFEESKVKFTSMVDSYKKEDLKSLLKMINDDPQYKDLSADLLDNRNKKWIPKMGKYMKEKSTVFAVGAGHLPGDNGVINLLKKQGYKLTPVKQ